MKPTTTPSKSLLAGCLLWGALALLGHSASATTLDFTPSGLQTGTINGALFEEIDPSYPAGSGVIDSFVRIQETGSAGPEQGYNTDARPVQFDEKTDATHTHTIRLADLQPVTIGGIQYYQFLLDINEPNGGTKSLLSLTQLQVFASSHGDLGASGKLYDSITHDFGALATKIYDINAGSTGYVLLDDTNAGSGRADMVFSVPVSAFAGLDPATTYIYLFSHFGDIINGEDGYQDQGGFEEWAARLTEDAGTPPPTPTPTPVATPTPTPGPTPGISLVKTGVYIPAGTDPATTSNVFGIAGNFNALIFGCFRAQWGDTDARLAVAGDLNIVGTSYSVGTAVKGHQVPIATGGTTDQLIVGGDFTDADWGVNGNIVCGGTRTGPERHLTNGNLFRHKTTITFDDNGNVPDTDNGATFDAIRAEMIDSSDELGTCADRGVVTKNASLPYRADLVGNDPTLNIFNVTAAEWSRTGSSINITAPAGSTVVVNIHGSSVTIANSGMHLTGVDLEHIVYNYVDATELHTTNFAHLGSVLAPHASCEFSAGSIDGRAVLGGCVHATNGFEFHNFFFNGEVTIPSPARIHYTFTVTNTGGVSLENIQIDDPMVDVNGDPISLDPGQTDSTTFTADYYPTDAEIAAGTLTNTATVTGTTSGGDTVSDTATHVLTFPGASSGGSSSGGGSSASPASTDPSVTVNGRAVRTVTAPRATLVGFVSGCTRLDILSGDAVFLPSRDTSITVDPAGARWKIRTGALAPGRNVIKLIGTSATGETTILTCVVKH
jgi:choice-of-anchor A domain-containing protein